MSSRDAILNKLRRAKQPFTDVPPVQKRVRVTPLVDQSSAALRKLFIEQAEKLACFVWQPADETEAIEKTLELIGSDSQVLSWGSSQLPLPHLAEVFSERGIAVADHRDGTVRVGISGVTAAIAATGSLILASSANRPRTVSLLPDVHIAVMTTEHLVPDLESWIEQQQSAGLATFRQHSNMVIISGASRTADIGMELVMGAHGPRDLHILLMSGEM